MSNYIYLIREREFIRLNEQTYKFGKTKQEPRKRFYGYGPGMEQILVRKVINCDSIENKIKKEFRLKFEQKRNYGTEYFNGNKNEMIKVINRIIDQEEKDSITPNKQEKYSLGESVYNIIAVGGLILYGIGAISNIFLDSNREKNKIKNKLR